MFTSFLFSKKKDLIFPEMVNIGLKSLSYISKQRINVTCAPATKLYNFLSWEVVSIVLVIQNRF